MTNAAVAANPPTMTVCYALRNGRAVVNRPLDVIGMNGLVQLIYASTASGVIATSRSPILPETCGISLVARINYLAGHRRRAGRYVAVESFQKRGLPWIRSSAT